MDLSSSYTRSSKQNKLPHVIVQLQSIVSKSVYLKSGRLLHEAR